MCRLIQRRMPWLLLRWFGKLSYPQPMIKFTFRRHHWSDKRDLESPIWLWNCLVCVVANYDSGLSHKWSILSQRVPKRPLICQRWLITYRLNRASANRLKTILDDNHCCTFKKLWLPFQIAKYLKMHWSRNSRKWYE